MLNRLVILLCVFLYFFFSHLWTKSFTRNLVPIKKRYESYFVAFWIYLVHLRKSFFFYSYSSLRIKKIRDYLRNDGMHFFLSSQLCSEMWHAVHFIYQVLHLDLHKYLYIYNRSKFERKSFFITAFQNTIYRTRLRNSFIVTYNYKPNDPPYILYVLRSTSRRIKQYPLSENELKSEETRNIPPPLER